MRAIIRHINQILATVMLVVFAIALTPFSIFHNHHSANTNSCNKTEVKCLHKQHFVNHSENCLVCSMHFEKTYTINHFSSLVFLKDTKIASYFFEVSASYTKLLGTSLRGPPAV